MEREGKKSGVNGLLAPVPFVEDCVVSQCGLFSFFLPVSYFVKLQCCDLNPLFNQNVSHLTFSTLAVCQYRSQTSGKQTDKIARMRFAIINDIEKLHSVYLFKIPKRDRLSSCDVKFHTRNCLGVSSLANKVEDLNDLVTVASLCSQAYV